MAENKWVSLGLFHPYFCGEITLLLTDRGPPCKILWIYLEPLKLTLVIKWVSLGLFHPEIIGVMCPYENNDCDFGESLEANSLLGFLHVVPGRW